MMQAAQHRPTYDLAGRVGHGRRRRPARRALAQPLMRSPRIEVGDVLVQHLLKVALVDDDHMVQTRTPRRSDPPLSQRVRPRRPHGRPDPRDAEPLHAAVELDPEPAVPVTDQIPRRVPFPATRVHDLLGRPGGGGMLAHPNLEDPSALVMHHEEDIQRLEEDRAHTEEVARPDVLSMARQELPPAGGRDAAIRLAHIFGDGPRRDREPESRELCLDAALAPEELDDGDVLY
jgi:hypothetical protein